MLAAVLRYSGFSVAPPVDLGHQGRITSAVIVPTDIIGINAQDWPHVASPAPSFSYGHFHTIDNKRVHWNAMHTAAGVYDWANMDTLVSALDGKSIFFCHVGTPTYLAQPADAAVVGPYGGAGEMSMPTSMADMQAFLTALVNRYPTIKAIQLGNEPTFTGNGSPLTTFWWGTAAQLVDYCYYARAAIKAARPDIVVTTPGVYDPTTFAAFLDATGTLSGVKGWQVAFDALCLHPYMAYPNSRTNETGMDLETLYIGGITPFRKLMTDRGAASLPVYISEYGVASSASHPRKIAFDLLTAAQRRQFIGRMGVAAARLGVKMISFFSFNSNSNLCGSLTEANGAGAGIGDAHDAVAGKTLTDAFYASTGVESGQCSDGSAYSI